MQQGKTTQFEKNFEASSARVKKRLAAYLRDPEDGKNVHAMRTSLRRLEAAFLLLPKKERKRNKKQADACKAFFRANSRVRDLDIISAKITALGGDPFVDAIAGKRKAALVHALALARSLEKNKMPLAANAIKKKKSIDGDKLAARMDKVAGRLVCAIEERLPVVVGDSSKKEELHGLRKDLKKLRYMLEILPAGRRKKYERAVAKVVVGGSNSNSGSNNVMARLKELQGTLGLVRDCDITIEYLQRVKGAGAVLQKGKDERDALYEKFAKNMMMTIMAS
ncbi:hypothetical protein NTE_00053 [Candidatus Nitrososphaera evergladensis SR1]|uniref:CHAD domain-containing protein n=1 Tax=Candidatus Nitrososphaera evergladensis SR1 TaxID=1459636 RepID=A0A075MMR8_9ARCH|nr:CHAD domain-containing protein [Candidatus Nitrososphaera evergladensis]AIF82137.1 hypothetical protein NTE_00053 [Candidatus Nitrososphaera evergladensis SR1]